MIYKLKLECKYIVEAEAGLEPEEVIDLLQQKFEDNNILESNEFWENIEVLK